MADAVVSVVNNQVVVEVQGLSAVAAIQAAVEQTQAEIEDTYDLIGEVVSVDDAYGGAFTQTAGGQMLHMVRPGEKPSHVRMAEAEARLDKLAGALPLFANRHALRAWRAQKRKLERDLDAGGGGGTKLKFGIGGDSWGDYTTVPQAFADRLYDEFGNGGEGLLSVGSVTLSAPINGVTIAKSGWTTFDLSNDAAPTGLCGLDGHSISATAAATYTIANCTATEFRVYYEKTGAFTWQVDSGSVTTVTTDGSGDLGILTLSSLSEAAHTLALAWSSGTVKILGVYATITGRAGAEVIKFGNAGLTGRNYSLLTDTAKAGMAAIAADIGLDAAVLMISTNDYRGKGLVENTVAGLRVMAGLLTVPPIIVAPARSNGTVYQPQDIYRDAFWTMSQEDDLPFYNMHDDWPDYATANAEGRWTDSLHSNASGAADVADAVGVHLLDLVP